jgi:hypothetical protein
MTADAFVRNRMMSGECIDVLTNRFTVDLEVLYQLLL